MALLMTFTEFTTLFDSTGLSSRQAARFLDVNVTTVNRWRVGDVIPGRPVQLVLASLASGLPVTYKE